MILEQILKLLFSLVGSIINLIPNLSGTDPLSVFAAEFSSFIDFLAYGFILFPFELFLIFIANAIWWLSVQMFWAFLEWLIKKIPGVN